jgi:hypothetical protein
LVHRKMLGVGDLSGCREMDVRRIKYYRGMTPRAFSLHAIAFLIAALTVVDVRADPSSSQIEIFVSKEGNCTVLSKELPCPRLGRGYANCWCQTIERLW